MKIMRCSQKKKKKVGSPPAPLHPFFSAALGAAARSLHLNLRQRPVFGQFGSACPRGDWFMSCLPLSSAEAAND
jgi:hypothetical protein